MMENLKTYIGSYAMTALALLAGAEAYALSLVDQLQNLIVYMGGKAEEAKQIAGVVMMWVGLGLAALFALVERGKKRAIEMAETAEEVSARVKDSAVKQANELRAEIRELRGKAND